MTFTKFHRGLYFNEKGTDIKIKKSMCCFMRKCQNFIQDSALESQNKAITDMNYKTWSVCQLSKAEVYGSLLEKLQIPQGEVELEE